jgi:hypothetical protein
MTTADMLRAEGRAEGRAEVLLEMLVEMLTFKFGPLPDSVTRTIHGTPTDQVRAWTIRAVTAETPDQVFADVQRLAAEDVSGGPAKAQRPVASGQSRPRSRRPVADIISEQRD